MAVANRLVSSDNEHNIDRRANVPDLGLGVSGES
jgi:hypothetical protein